MSGSRFVGRSIVGVVLALACVQIGRAQIDTPREKSAVASTCKVYSLADLGGDPEMCKWIADTIPRVIQPESWRGTKNTTLTYHAPAKILVVYHTPAAHAEIEAFLTNLQKTTQQAKVKETPRDPVIYYPPLMPAQFQAPAPPPAPPPAQQYQGSYPVPFPPTAPKHLFHFIIRYEGQGIIDENVVQFARALTDASKGTTEENKGTTAKSYLNPPPSSQPATIQPAGGAGFPSALSIVDAPPPGTGPRMPPADAPPAPSSAPPPPTCPPPPASR